VSEANNDNRKEVLFFRFAHRNGPGQELYRVLYNIFNCKKDAGLYAHLYDTPRGKPTGYLKQQNIILTPQAAGNYTLKEINLKTAVHLPLRHRDTEETMGCRIILFHLQGEGCIPAFFLTFQLCASVSLWLTAFSMISGCIRLFANDLSNIAGA